jgi:FMN phosphatase YigB (HAD superfamily)
MTIDPATTNSASRPNYARGYLEAMALAGGVSPQEAVYVGDNYYTDIVGANGIGMRAILVDEHELFSDIDADCLVLRQLAELEIL